MPQQIIYDHIYLETDFYNPGCLSFSDKLLWEAVFSWIQAAVKAESSGGSNKVPNKERL